MKHLVPYNESTDSDIQNISDALIISFMDSNIDIEEIESMTHYYPEDSILMRRREGHVINIDGICFCITYMDRPTGIPTYEKVIPSIKLCIIYNTRKYNELYLEKIFRTFYRRIVKFGWCKDGSKISRNIGNHRIFNFYISKVKTKDKNK